MGRLFFNFKIMLQIIGLIAIACTAWYFCVATGALISHRVKYPELFKGVLFSEGVFYLTATCTFIMLIIGFLWILNVGNIQSVQIPMHYKIQQKIEYKPVTKTFYEKIEQ